MDDDDDDGMGGDVIVWERFEFEWDARDARRGWIEVCDW